MPLVLVVVNKREAAVRFAGPVLVGGVHRGVAAIEVDSTYIESAEELSGVADTRARSAYDRHVPSMTRQLRCDFPRNLRRSAAR